MQSARNRVMVGQPTAVRSDPRSRTGRSPRPVAATLSAASGAGFYEMFVAPPRVTTSAQWAGWWLSSKLRGPVLDAHDLGLTNNQFHDPDLVGPSGPRW